MAKRAPRRDGLVLGAHVSAAGGLWTAFDRAEEAGCDCMQIFTKNKGAWAAPPLTEETVAVFHARAAASRVRPVVVHASYLINVASPGREIREKSIEALRIELERCELLGIPHLVFHPGAHLGEGEAAGLRRVAASLDRVHRSTRGSEARILLENSAGQGSSLCTSFASLRRVLDRVAAPERLGVCIDTCHAFAAGHDIRTTEGLAAMVDELSGEVGLERVRCIHLNDSKKPLGSRVDRHEHIGKGLLGRATFRRILAEPRLRRIPMLFELPPENDMTRVNLRVLRSLAPKG